MRIYLTIFLACYFSMILLLMALNFLLPDLVVENPTQADAFLLGITDSLTQILWTLSLGAKTCDGIICIGFPISSSVLALFCYFAIRFWKYLLLRLKAEGYGS